MVRGEIPRRFLWSHETHRAASIWNDKNTLAERRKSRKPTRINTSALNGLITTRLIAGTDGPNRTMTE